MLRVEADNSILRGRIFLEVKIRWGADYPPLLRDRIIRPYEVPTAAFRGNGHIPGQGYIYPHPSSSSSCSTCPHKNTIVKPQIFKDLPLHPINLADLWRIEGEDPDLQLHRPVLHFPLICLRAPLLLCFFGNPRAVGLLSR